MASGWYLDAFGMSRKGHDENSPAIHRWVYEQTVFQVPSGTAELADSAVPDGTSFIFSYVPSDKSLG